MKNIALHILNPALVDALIAADARHTQSVQETIPAQVLKLQPSAAFNGRF